MFSHSKSFRQRKVCTTFFKEFNNSLLLVCKPTKDLEISDILKAFEKTNIKLRE